MRSLTGVASGDVRSTPESRHKRRVRLMSANDPKRTLSSIHLCCHVRVSGQVLRYAAKAAVDEKPVAGGVLVEVPRLPKTVLGEHR